MTLVTINFEPGIVQDNTDLASKNTFADGDKVRFRSGYAQPIGGWEAAGGGTFENPVRGAHAWAALTGDRVVAFGTASHLYSFFGGQITDITPLKAKGTLVNPFEMSNGSTTVIVTDVDHGLAAEDTVTFALADAVGGITIDGTYTVDRILTIDQYTITASSAATSSATGGGKVEFSAPLTLGNIDGVGGTGWGTGTFGTGTFGLPSGGDINPRVWSCDNWGQNGVFVQRNGALYEWQPISSYDELIGNGGFDDTSFWSLGTGWSIGSGVATATAGSLSGIVQTVTGNLTGGTVYESTIEVVSVSAGSLQFHVESSDVAIGDIAYGEAITKPGTYTRRFRADSRPNILGWVKDAAFAGSIDNVSVKVASDAYRIQSAPAYSIGMFVDPNRFVVCYGTIEADGDFNPLLVRWSDQEDIESWIPDTDNLAGEHLLARGSRVVGAVPGRGQNLVWTDDALYTMRFTTGAEVFRFDLAGTGCGLLGKNAAVEHQGMVFWWARNGQLYIYQGGEPKVIPCSVRRTAWRNLSPSQEEKVFAAVNAEFNEIWWFYPDKRDMKDDGSPGTECSRYISYNWADGTWMTGILPRTAWITAGIYSNPIGFGADDGMIYFHERGNTANGATMDWSLTTGKFNIGDGDTLFRIGKYVPDFDDQAGNITVNLTFSQWQRGSAMSTVERTITPTTKAINLRQLGRECQITWSAEANSAFARFGSQRFDVEKTGAKR